ncbi:MAG: enoyl-CoA hydratase [Desulfobacterales bacterium GWB2_56_26]|nr:MAG: enoyl-CoA hydratase [Desulfobacterales bacterium GWB2_56_26]
MARIYADIKVGDKACVEKTISESDVYLFAGITGDLNPAHVNEEAMKKSKFGGRIAHGMLSAGFISAVLGMQLPGPGTIYLSQTLQFKAPVRIGDTVKAEAEVIEKLEKGRIKLKTTCSIQDGTVVADGEAMVIAPRE